ncbi:MAG: tetratricopeptide repeat protein [Chloroflexi bacterium]|nr:tetratricopeptide repeat protein [Chloroflexota bacterium]
MVVHDGSSATLVMPVSEGRLRVPRRRAIHVVRRRLVDALIGSLDQKVTLVVAAAGSGKTSLVADFVGELGWPCAWYSAVADDADPIVACSYLAAAIERAIPGFGASVRRLIDRVPGMGAPVASDVAAAIVDEIERTVSVPFFLVVDDVAAIALQPEVAAVLEQIILQAPDSCHIVLTGRIAPRLRLTNLLAENRIFVLGPADLRLTEQEVAELIEQHGNLPAGAPTAAELLAATDGWVTGVVMALPRLARAPSPHAALQPTVHMLTSGVLDALPEPLRRFAGDLAVLQTFSLETCREVLGYSDAATLIEQLEAASPFIERLDGQGDWFRLHQLFQTALIERRWRDNPQRLHQVAARVAAWAFQQGNVEEAVRLSVLAEDRSTVVRLLRERGLQFFEGGRLRQLADWLDQLPGDVLEAEPDLDVLRARIELYLGDRTKALLRAERVLRCSGLTPRTEVSARLVVIAALWLTGHPDQALLECDRAAAVAAQLTDRRPALEIARYRASVLGVAGRLREALDQLLAIRDDPAQTEFARAIVDEQLGLAFAKMGDLAESRRYFLMALSRWDALGNRLQGATARVSLGNRCQELGDYAQAHEHLDRALADAVRTGHHRAIGFARHSLATLLRAEGRFAEAEAEYQAALATAKRAGESALVGYCQTGLARLAISQDNAAGAEGWLRQAGLLVQEIGARDVEREIDIAWARLLLRAHLSETAAVRLEDAARWLQSSRQEVLWSGACLWLAAARAAGGDFAGARQAWEAPPPRLRQAAEFVLDPVERREIERYLSGALGPRLLWSTPTPPPRHNGGSVRRLTIQSLGATEVRLNGRPALLTSNRALDLLLYLLTQSAGVTREHLAARLWSDLGSTDRHSQFHNALLRLRQGLYPGVVRHRGGLYTVDPELVVEWDADEFEDLTRLVRGSAAMTPAVAAAGRRIFDLYRGDFLAQLGGDWQLAHRFALQTALIETARHLAALFQHRGSPGDALGVLERAAAFAPSDEAIQIDLLRSLVAAGRRSEARRRWRALIARLREDLNVEPAPALLELEQELLSAASNRSRRQLDLRQRTSPRRPQPPA